MLEHCRHKTEADSSSLLIQQELIEQEVDRLLSIIWLDVIDNSLNRRISRLHYSLIVAHEEREGVTCSPNPVDVLLCD
jgi:hypothetical protein